MQPDQEFAGTNLSVNRLAIRRALNATGNEPKASTKKSCADGMSSYTRIGMILSKLAILTSVLSERRQA